MLAGTQSATLLAGGELESMIPSHSEPSISKRKNMDDPNPSGNAAKRAKKDMTGGPGVALKRKFDGEKQPGGLVIVRAPPTRSTPSQDSPTDAQPQPPPRSSSTQPPPQHPPNANVIKPPSKKFKAAASEDVASQAQPPNTRPPVKGKLGVSPNDVHSEAEVDTDATQVQQEANKLRQQPRTAASDKSSTNLGPVSRTPQPHTPNSHERIHDTSVPIPLTETPQIKKNKIMRGEMPHRRRSSVSRGKRASSSFENTGVITQPHTSVADSTFYKHIDVDMPEPQRAQQLLIWCSFRAMSELSEDLQTASNKRNARSTGKDPPQISKEDLQLLKGVQEDVTRMLAEKKVDTNVFSPAASKTPQALKENEQNVSNKARERRFKDKIHRSEMEKEAWDQVDHFYKSFKSQTLADLEHRQRELTQSLKGKGKATWEDVAKWDLDEQDLPAQFRGDRGIGLARSLLSQERGKKSAVGERMEDLEFMVDRLHSLTYRALQTTRTIESDLDRRFALLNLSLASRSQPTTSNLTSTATPLSSYLPTTTRPPPTTDPQDLLRALSHLDAARPQSQVGDAARRAAREMQRMNDANGGFLAERRLTGVAPSTPRKPPGTPRRGGR